MRDLLVIGGAGYGLRRPGDHPHPITDGRLAPRTGSGSPLGVRNVPGAPRGRLRGLSSVINSAQLALGLGSAVAPAGIAGRAS
jgi:hypothetical protein